MLLHLQGCKDAGSSEAGSAPKPERNISPGKLLSVIRAAERPFVVVSFFPMEHDACKAVLPDLTRMETAEGGKASVVLVVVDAKGKSDADLQKYLGGVGAQFTAFTIEDDPQGFVMGLDSLWDGGFPVSFLYRNSGEAVELIKGLPDQEEITLMVNHLEKLGHN
jgi:hypothetical protein